MQSGLKRWMRVGVALLIGCAFTLAQAAIDKLPAGVSAADWQQIQAQIASQRQQFQATPEGYRAEQVAQGWQMTFDVQGFLVRPKQAENGRNWQWGLALKSYGVGSQEQAIAATPRLAAQGMRLDYNWNANLTEWLINDAKGLEHGFTLSQRPAGSGETLHFSLAVRGDLRAQARLGGQGVRFVDASGQHVLDYAGLKVFDARGRGVPARLSVQADVIQLAVDDRSAVYPLTIDPTAQQAYLKASNTGVGDYFGWSVAISGDTLVVGAVSESSSATGVNGDQTDNSASQSGAAYVFVRDSVSKVWTQQAYLKASNTGAGDYFGWSVAISGDTIVVGAVGEGGNSIGINGDQEDNSAFQAGAAYVFVRSGTIWSQQAYLKASNTGASDSFGRSVAISGDSIVVGAPWESSNATGVNGNQADNSAVLAGAAYVFVRSAGVWSQQAYLKASNTEMEDWFGYSVAISGDTIVVAAALENSSATGVNGNQANNLAIDAGAAYVFVRSGTTWSQQAYLKASNAESDDRFGGSMAISGDTLVVGAYGESSNATGVNGNQADNSASDAGAAYVFTRNAGVWSQQAYLKASNTGANDKFGYSVAISGDTIVVGAYAEGSSATGVDGNGNDNSAVNAGAAYVFTRNAGAWSPQAYLKASNTEASDFFGRSVVISGDTIVVGAQVESSNATGVNGNQADNSASGAGAAYVFKLNADVTPDAFSFTAQTGVALSGTIESNAITVGGIDIPVPISISGGSYKIGSGACTSSAGMVNPGDSVKVCLASSASYNTLSSATLTIGGVSASFSATTLASSNADLSTLSLSSGSLSPAFAASTTGYSVIVANGIGALSVTPTVADANAGVKVNGSTVASGTGSGAINLAVGSNTITVVVTAQDGTTSKTYTVTVTRSGQASFSGSLPGGGQASVSLSSGTTCGFASASFVSLATVSATPPAGYRFDNGLFQFTLNGCPAGQPVQLSITYPGSPGSAYWKYGPTPGQPAHWYQIPASVSGNTVSFTVTDGGLGDDDGLADGNISDAGGPAIPLAGASAVPTLGEWALLLLAGLVGLLGARSRWHT